MAEAQSPLGTCRWSRRLQERPRNLSRYLRANADVRYNGAVAADRPEAAQLGEEGYGVLVRYRDAARLELAPYALQRPAATGEVEKLRPGHCRLADAELSGMATIALVAALVPPGNVCLPSAVRIHGSGPQTPHEVWLGLDRKAGKPSRLPARVRIVRFFGVKTHRIFGVPVRVTSPARTVVDSFRYGKKVSLDVATHALCDPLCSRLTTMGEFGTVEVCRVINELTYSLTVRHLSLSDVLKVRRGLPALRQQRAISAVLDREMARIDAVIAMVREVIERFKEYRTAFISGGVTGEMDVKKAVAA